MCFSMASLAVCAVLTNCADIAMSTASSGERQVGFTAKIKARYLSNSVSSSEDKFFLYAIADDSGGSYMVTPTNNAFTVGDIVSIAGTSRFFSTIDNFAVFPKDIHLLRHEDPEPPTPASAAQIADALGVSRNVLDKRFHADLNRSIGAEITRQRIALAKLLLRNTDNTVAEIAKSAGFCTPSHLANTFRATSGVTPREYRNQ